MEATNTHLIYLHYFGVIHHVTGTAWELRLTQMLDNNLNYQLHLEGRYAVLSLIFMTKYFADTLYFWA